MFLSRYVNGAAFFQYKGGTFSVKVVHKRVRVAFQGGATPYETL